jgi:CubicO group peptidase (beta-lactamase class C family)
MLTPRSLFSLAATLTLSFGGSSTAVAEEPTLEQRLQKLAADLEEARVEAHIPGMSIAVVKDDEVVMARGFGLADVENERPADAETIYAIGSTTKAFTATLVGMLADEGKATWDDPVTEHLPYFDLAVDSDDPDAQCTLRDLLSHRHGFARMGLLWSGGQVSREEVLRTASGAEPFDGFREAFHYCNVTYLAAGEAAGVADGTSWDEMMVGRIFEPLGMSSSTLTAAAAQEDPRLAVGYEWYESSDRIEPRPMVELVNIAPAGSVNSSVLDMAQWLRLQLGMGEVDDMRLISTEGIRETWSPMVSMGGNTAYGLGWMLREHDGRKLVEHGGNIDGFSAQVGMIPSEGVGYVLLMNLNVAPLQQQSLALVFDALLDEWPDEPAVAEASTPAELDYDEYLGTYIANFASFRDEEFEVQRTEEGIALHIPSQQTFELEDPDADGKWFFVLTNQVAVEFVREEGEIVALAVNQGGYRFEAPREELELDDGLPTEELERYTGTYQLAEGSKRIEITIARGGLAILDKGQMLAFEAPDATGRANLRARPEQGATFQADAEGNVEALVFHGNAGDRLFRRVSAAGADAGDVPTLEEVLALRDVEARIAALQEGGGTRVTGEVWVPQAGVRGELTLYARGLDHYAHHMDFGKFGRVDTCAAGDEAWSYTSMRGLRVLEGKELTQAILGHPGAVEGDWSAYFDTIEVVRNEAVGDRPAHVVKLRRADMPSRSYWIDAETGDVLQMKLVALEGRISIPVTVTYSDYREVDGVRRPMRAVLENPASGRMVMTLAQYERGLDLGDEVFRLEDPEAGEARD